VNADAVPSNWQIKFDTKAAKAAKKLGRVVHARVLDFLETRVATSHNPRDLGQALNGTLAGYWRYRVGDYRIICDIQDETITILVIEIGHRSMVYR
jgi:mRNA interferase RelE/StbE